MFFLPNLGHFLTEIWGTFLSKSGCISTQIRLFFYPILNRKEPLQLAQVVRSIKIESGNSFKRFPAVNTPTKPCLWNQLLCKAATSAARSTSRSIGDKFMSQLHLRAWLSSQKSMNQWGNFCFFLVFSCKMFFEDVSSIHIVQQQQRHMIFPGERIPA